MASLCHLRFTQLVESSPLSELLSQEELQEEVASNGKEEEEEEVRGCGVGVGLV